MFYNVHLNVDYGLVTPGLLVKQILDLDANRQKPHYFLLPTVSTNYRSQMSFQEDLPN